MSRGALVALVIGLVFGVAIGMAVEDLRQIGRWLASSQTASAPHFAEEKPAIMRRALWPDGADAENPEFALILTEYATGDAPVIVEDAEALRLHGQGATVRYTHQTKADKMVIGVLSLGIALRHYRDYALLVHDGAVTDVITCWKCDVNGRDFRGTRQTALIDAGTPVFKHRFEFMTQAAYDAALDQARATPDTWVDTTAPMGRTGPDDTPRWTFTSWRRGTAP